MSTWTGSLPQVPEASSYTDTMPGNVIATQMDTGIAKRRMRSTTAPRVISMTMYLSDAQCAVFDTFYMATTHYGADSFIFPVPVTGSVSVHFQPGNPPRRSPRGIGMQLSFSVEVDP